MFLFRPFNSSYDISYKKTPLERGTTAEPLLSGWFVLFFLMDASSYSYFNVCFFIFLNFFLLLLIRSIQPPGLTQYPRPRPEAADDLDRQRTIVYVIILHLYS